MALKRRQAGLGTGRLSMLMVAEEALFMPGMSTTDGISERDREHIARAREHEGRGSGRRGAHQRLSPASSGPVQRSQKSRSVHFIVSWARLTLLSTLLTVLSGRLSPTSVSSVMHIAGTCMHAGRSGPVVPSAPRSFALLREESVHLLVRFEASRWMCQIVVNFAGRVAGVAVSTCRKCRRTQQTYVRPLTSGNEQVDGASSGESASRAVPRVG